MIRMAEFMDALWGFLATGLIHGTVLAAMTWVLSRTLLRRARPALMSALWTIVLLKFLVPVGPEVPISLSGLVNGVFDSNAGDELMTPLAVTAAAQQGAMTSLSAGEWMWLIFQLLATLVYVGLVGHLLVKRVGLQRAHRMVAGDLPPAGPETLAVAEKAARTLGMKRIPRVHMSDDMATPQIIGLWRPILIVPAYLLAYPATLEAALLHELAHLRRGDTWLRGLQLVAATLLFFWPVVRWVNRRIDDHREMACDQWAIAWGRLSPGAYARALVALATRARAGRQLAGNTMAGISTGALLSLAMLRGRKQLEVRVSALLRGPTRPRMGLISGAGLVLWALISLGGAAGQRAHAATGPAECTIQPGVAEYILATYPEADTDGDGALSRDEVCAHQKRLKEMISLDSSAEGSAEERLNLDPLLASPDSEWFDCQACGCGANEPLPESAQVSFDKKICSNE